MFANKTHEKAEKALKEGKLDKAIDLYSKALKESPNHIDIISDRGVAYLNINKEKECFEDLDRAITLQPDYGYRYACRAFAKKNFGILDGAIEDYKKAVELDPSDEIGHNNLGLLLEQKGYQDEAEKRFEQAKKLSEAEDRLLDVTVTSRAPLTNYENSAAESSKSEKFSEDAASNSEGAKDDNDEENDETTTKMKEFRKVFTSTEQLKEFLGFLKNGFKIK